MCVNKIRGPEELEELLLGRQQRLLPWHPLTGSFALQAKLTSSSPVQLI